MWETLKRSLRDMIESENKSLNATAVDKVTDRLMMTVRKKAYEDVLSIMGRVEEDA